MPIETVYLTYSGQSTSSIMWKISLGGLLLPDLDA